MVHLITGGKGFIGSHLEPYLRELYPKDTVHSIDRKECDLTDRNATHSLIARLQPDRVYHFSGLARATGTDDFPQWFGQNFLATVHLLEGLEANKKKVSLFLASSAHVYGNQEKPVSEETPAHPETAYGFTKYLAEQAARRSSEKNSQIQVIVGRLNNCIGPGQKPGFVIADLCSRIRETVQKGGDTLTTGPLEDSRTFMDVRDLVKILPEILELPQASHFEIYNIASEHQHTIRLVAETLVSFLKAPLKLVPKSGVAPNSFKGVRISVEKFNRALHPTFRPLKDTLKDALDYELRKGTPS